MDKPKKRHAKISKSQEEKGRQNKQFSSKKIILSYKNQKRKK